MSLGASHKPETIAALLFEQALDFELGFGGSAERHSQLEHRLPLGRSALESRFDEHKARAAQNSIDQKEILEPICVNSRNPPPFHCNVLPAKTAPGKTSTALTYVASELSSHPTLYGDLPAQVDSTSRVPCGGTRA